MIFMALLKKELRSRLRRERTIWLLVIYILILGSAGWLVVNSISAQNATYDGNSLSQAGKLLYYILSILQLLLITFIIPAFTATAINGEKERQTFDLLMCSQLSGFTLITGKLVGGMVNALLLIASSIPLFSLLLLFGGIAPVQLLGVLLIYIITALVIGSFGLLFSILFRRPAISTAITYLFNLLWLAAPAIILFFWETLAETTPPSPDQTALIMLWNPIAAIISLDTTVSSTLSYPIGGLAVPIWIIYSAVSLLLTSFILLLCMYASRNNVSKIRFIGKRHSQTFLSGSKIKSLG